MIVRTGGTRCVALAAVSGLVVAAGPADADPVGIVSRSPAQSTITTVTLMTGDWVTLIGLPDGKPGVSVQAGPGGSTAFATERLGGEMYVIPSDAQPFVGHQLDVRLFDVTTLAGSSDGRIPVTISYADGSAAPRLARGSPTIRMGMSRPGRRPTSVGRCTPASSPA